MKQYQPKIKQGATGRIVHAVIPAVSDSNRLHAAKCLFWTIAFLSAVYATIIAGGR